MSIVLAVQMKATNRSIEIKYAAIYSVVIVKLISTIGDLSLICNSIMLAM